MIYPLNAFRKKTTTVKDTELPFYEVSMWTTKPYCPKCGSNKKISIDHKIEKPLVGFDLVQDEPSKVSVIDACFFRCHNTPLCSRFQDPWIPFGSGGQKFSVQYYQYLIDTYLLEDLTVNQIRAKYLQTVSRPLSDAVTNCRLAIGNYLACKELWFIQIPYLDRDRCIVLGLPADGDNNPVLLTICASPAEVSTFRNKIDTEKIKAIACDCKFEYFYAIRDAFFLDLKTSDVKVVFNSSMLKEAIDVAVAADHAKLDKEYEGKINNDIKSKKDSGSRLKESDITFIQNKHYSQLGDMQTVLDRLQAKIQTHFSNLINNGSTRKTLSKILEDSYFDYDDIEGTCRFIDFEKDFPSMFQVAHCINSIEIILKKQSGAKSVCRITTDTQANARKVKVIDQLEEFENGKIPFDVAVLKLLFGDHTNFHRRLAENSAYADFLKKCYEQRKTVEKGYHKMKLSLSDQIAFSSECSNTMDPSKQISMTDFFSAMAPYRELEYYSAMLQLLKKNNAGDVHVTDPDIPEWEMIVAAVSEEITPWQYRAIWKDVHTVIPIDLEKI